MTYQTPALKANQHAKASLTIKKSEFIAFAYHVSNREQVNACLNALKNEFPDARHHCMGYIIGNPDNTTSAGFDDDGEPSGTAGKPILNVLQHKKIGNCAIIVVRYFGGIKLGAGGLTRAYAQAAQAVIDVLALADHVPLATLSIVCDFAFEAQVRFLLEKYSGKILQTDYRQRVSMTAILPKIHTHALGQDFGGMAVDFTVE